MPRQRLSAGHNLLEGSSQPGRCPKVTTSLAARNAPDPAAAQLVDQLADEVKAEELADLLARHSETDPDFWTFKANGIRQGSHGIFQYPAMMVPQLQRTLLDDLLKVDREVKTIYDPFVGSGTVLIEAMLRGLNVVAADINPMALLLCAVKARPIGERSITRAIERVAQKAIKSSEECDLSFPGIDKWFTRRAKTELFRLRVAIANEGSKEIRRFLWVSLAETIRLTSNSRTSTFKLHLYSSDVMADRDPRPIQVFQEVSRIHSHLLEKQSTEFSGRNLLNKRRYVNAITLILGDVRESTSPLFGTLRADALMTSPPYGDNQTTVPYGQHSYLPLQWITASDLPGPKGSDCRELYRDAYFIDHISIGGSLVGADRVEAMIAERSESLARTIDLLRSDDNPALRRKLITYARDLDQSLSAIIDRLRPGAFMFWTLGARRVGGLPIPLTEIVREMLEKRDAVHIHTLERQIPANKKRMALRNDRGATMRAESVLVMRKSGS
jgi:Putative RNA methylase family UPF0020